MSPNRAVVADPVPASAGTARPSTFAALKGRNYRLYWLGLVFYVLGHLLHNELGSRRPSTRRPDGLRQDKLTFRREFGRLHATSSLVRDRQDHHNKSAGAPPAERPSTLTGTRQSDVVSPLNRACQLQ